jgi:hypothetical protein
MRFRPLLSCSHSGAKSDPDLHICFERATRFELATLTLAKGTGARSADLHKLALYAAQRHFSVSPIVMDFH